MYATLMPAQTALMSPDSLQSAIMLSGRTRTSAVKMSRTIRQFQTWQKTNPQARKADSDTAFAMWLNSARASKLSPALVRARLTAGKTWFSHSKADPGILATYQLPPLPEPVPHPLPAGIAGVRAMLAHSSGSGRIIIALQGLAGLRVAEARTVTRENIDPARRRLIVRGKGEKIRRVPISDELWAILETAPLAGRLAPLSDSGARGAVTRAANKAGVIGPEGKDVSSHDLRATFATACFDKTRDIMLVSRLLGHSSVTTTQRYLATTMDDMALAVEL